MSKYIDLTNQIRRDVGGNLAPTVAILQWLDRNPDQAPGRTITESRLREIESLKREVYNWTVRRTIQEVGIEIVPDPESTNAERLEQLIRESGFSITYAGQNSDPIELAEYLNEDGVKAPDHD